MRKFNVIVALAALIALIALAMNLDRPSDKHAGSLALVAANEVSPDSQPSQVAAMGNSSCSAQACHGDPVPQPVPQSAWGSSRELDRWRSSYTMWQAYDPHAHAYAVLFNDASKKIARALGGPKAQAHKDSRCLACHSNPTLARSAQNDDELWVGLQADAVGCEACHGNAGNWINTHLNWPAGPGHHRRYARDGMTDLNTIARRARICADCHVGAAATENIPARDVNHDLIAAGHPRLNFDYGTYIRVLPPHWIETNRDLSPPEVRSPGRQLSDWVVGRTATNAAAFELLADRTRRRWPELAEFDCYSCHHDLQSKESATGHGLSSGRLRWNAPPLWTAICGIIDSPNARAETVKLQEAMTFVAKAPEIRQRALSAAAQWRKSAGDSSVATIASTTVFDNLAHEKIRRWVDACHLYYALQAMSRSGSLSWLHPNGPRLLELRNQIRFSRSTNGTRFNSPKDFDLTRTSALFADLLQRRAQ